jgi:predicted phosphodiesterase
MRFAVLADIHGNLPALEAVMADLAQFEVEQVVVAGDLINWGPDSAAVVERVTAAGWAALRGNNEYYLLDADTPRAPAYWAEWQLLPWLRRQLDARGWARVAAWPDAISLRPPDAPPALVTHGSPRSRWEGLFPDTPAAQVATILEGVEEQTIVAAHTHLAMDRVVAGRRILNPGSVGIPLDGRHGASYLLLEARAGAWRATLRRVPVDLAPLFAAFERQHFIEECGVTGQLVVAEFRTARLWVDPFMRWRAATCPAAPLTPALLARFSDAERWAWTPDAYRLNLGGQP